MSTVATATAEAGKDTTVYSDQTTGSTGSTASTAGYSSSSDFSTTDFYGTKSTPPPEGSSSPGSGNLAEWLSSLNELAKMDGDWNIISIQDVQFMDEDDKVPGASGVQIKMFRAYGN